MILKIFYESINPHHSSMTQTFIGIDYNDCWNQKCDYEEYIEVLNDNNIRNIYNIKVISNPDFKEWNEKN